VRFRKTALFIVLAGLFYFLSRCDKSDSGSPSAVAPAPLQEVRLGYFANVTHAQAVLGVASGDFQNALGETKLTPKVFNAGPDLIQALNAGAIDIAYIGPGPVIVAQGNSNGQALRVISGAAANGVAIVARDGSGISTIKDLVGKKIATPQHNNTQDVACRHYLTTVLGQTDTDNVLPVGNLQQVALMATEKIDAAWAPEPWASRLIAQDHAVLIAEEKDLWPNHQFALTVVVARPDFLRDHPDVVEKILGVHRQWTKKLSDDPVSCKTQLHDALFALTKADFKDDVLVPALKRTQFTDDPMKDTFTTMAQWSADLKILKSVPDQSVLFPPN
jgi:NitT/TauT family transport system substrate-binding protein